MTWTIHPADWRNFDAEHRAWLVYSGQCEYGIDWRVWRVAELTGVDPEALDQKVTEAGWETHDKGYLHRVVQAVEEVQ